MDYPSNSGKSREPKDVKRVTSGAPVQRKKPLGKQFRETFIGGDARATANYMIFDVLIPAARDALVDAGGQGLERLIHGESRTGRRRGPSSGGSYISYNRMSTARTPPPEPDERRMMSNRARAQHNFEEIVLENRVDAERALEGMFDVLSKYDAVSVADLYSLIGLSSTAADNTWGWMGLPGARVTRVRTGYFLDIPDPEYLR